MQGKKRHEVGFPTLVSRNASEHWSPGASALCYRLLPRFALGVGRGRVGALLIGVGIGVGFGLLIAPTRGKEMRADIADRVSDFGEKVREHIGKKPQGATGTYGE